jgi:glucose/arabinose dehydrogenase
MTSPTLPTPPTPLSPKTSPLSSTRVRVGALLGVVVIVILAGWTLTATAKPGGSPSPSSGIGQASLAPGGSAASSTGAGSSSTPGGSGGVAPSAGATKPGATPATGKKPTPAPTPRRTPTPAPRAVTSIKLATAYSGFSAPIFVTGAHDGTNRLFVVQQSGQIKVIVSGKTQATPFLNISGLIKYGGEQGLLGLAFSPSFRTNGHFYVYYNQAGSGNIVVVQYTAANHANVADAGSAKILISPIDHTAYSNHNGGMLAFGPDGLLYFGTGDGGGAGNPLESAQNLNSMLGKILRINVNVSGAKPVIWAYGLRNPWRWSFDSATGDIWIGDVGQDRYEEIDHVSRAAVVGSTKINFGWNVWEGRSCYPSGTGCSAHGVTMPIAVYAHGTNESVGCAVTGGYVYRGPVAALRGNYFFGDYCSGRIWRLVARSGNQTPVQVADTALNITSFGTDDAGNEYVVAANGRIYRIGL